jgi:hypothetical protein
MMKQAIKFTIQRETAQKLSFFDVVVARSNIIKITVHNPQSSSTL